MDTECPFCHVGAKAGLRFCERCGRMLAEQEFDGDEGGDAQKIISRAEVISKEQVLPILAPGGNPPIGKFEQLTSESPSGQEGAYDKKNSRQELEESPEKQGHSRRGISSESIQALGAIKRDLPDGFSIWRSSRGDPRVLVAWQGTSAAGKVWVSSGDRIWQWNEFQPGASQLIAPPGEAQSLAACFDREGLTYCVQYSLVDPLPRIEFGHAIDAGRVRIRAKGGPPPAVKVGHAGDIGIIEYEYDSTGASEEWVLLPVSVQTVFPQWPAWIRQEVFEQITLFVGQEATLGRSRTSSWELQCWDEAGNVIAVDRWGRNIHDPARSDAKCFYLVSRTHATLHWHGAGRIYLMDGSTLFRSKRGVFVNGVALDSQGNTVDLPCTFTLGPPDKPHVEIECGLLPGSDKGDAALFLRTVHPFRKRLFVWLGKNRSIPLAARAERGFWPAPLRWMARLSFHAEGMNWLMETPKGSHILHRGDEIPCGEGCYRVKRAEQNVLVLEM